MTMWRNINYRAQGKYFLIIPQILTDLLEDGICLDKYFSLDWAPCQQTVLTCWQESLRQFYFFSRGYDPDSLAYFKIIPKYIATLSPGSSVDVPGTCWDSVKVSYFFAENRGYERGDEACFLFCDFSFHISLSPSTTSLSDVS